MELNMRGWDFFYFSRRSRKQRLMAGIAHSLESEVTYSFLAEEYADEASLAMRCESAVASRPRSTIIAGRLERFQKFMKKCLVYRDPAKTLQAERCESDLLSRLHHVVGNPLPTRPTSDLMGTAAP
jgi:hypothetical protein